MIIIIIIIIKALFIEGKKKQISTKTVFHWALYMTL